MTYRPNKNCREWYDPRKSAERAEKHHEQKHTH